MLIVLSPAKSLVEGPAVSELPATEPPLLDQASQLVDVLRPLSADDLKALMGISDQLAELNADRYRAFSTPFTRDNARQAGLLFAGDVYRGLDAATLDADDLAFAQEHVAILSGLYGVLRPLDLAQPYRLEMGTSLDNPRGKDLYAFWGDRITEQLSRWLSDHEDRTLVNLASNEYFKSVKKKGLPGRVVVPVFKEEWDGKSRTVSFYAKHARGLMTRWVVQNRITDPERLKAFAEDGYTFRPDASTATRWVYARPKPEPKT